METKSPYHIITVGGTGEIEEKKSRFIAHIEPVETEEEALQFIEKMKKQFWDARHNCSAYILGSRKEICRFSDDGEPQGTAGRPMLEVLQGMDLCNVCVVVTRYFGGVLLGTGGLVRAYTQAVQEGLKSCEIKQMQYGQLLKLTTDYNGVGKLQYLFANAGINIMNSQYTDTVSMQIIVPAEQSQKIQKDITEATSGRTEIEILNTDYYLI